MLQSRKLQLLFVNQPGHDVLSKIETTEETSYRIFPAGYCPRVLSRNDLDIVYMVSRYYLSGHYLDTRSLKSLFHVAEQRSAVHQNNIVWG